MTTFRVLPELRGGLSFRIGVRVPLNLLEIRTCGTIIMTSCFLLHGVVFVGNLFFFTLVLHAVVFGHHLSISAPAQ